MEVRLGNIFGFTGGNYAGNVYDQNYMCPTLNTMHGGYKQPMIIDDTYANRKPRTYEEYSPALRSDREGFKTIVAISGRNPDNPSDRTVGAPTEQRLEPNSQGLCNTLTSVQKDNLVMEKVKIKQATKQGYIECEVGGVADFSYPDSETRRGIVQDNGNTCPTLTAESQDICRIEMLEKPVLLGGVGEENEFGTQYRQGNRVYSSNAVAMCLNSQPVGNTGGNSYLYNVNYRIRKLTPRECWRLMDFSDEDFEKAAQVNSNTQLYKQAGNSIVRNVLVAILGQMIPGKEDVYKQ